LHWGLHRTMCTALTPMGAACNEPDLSFALRMGRGVF
jgi:hypothetical protein